MDDGGTSTGPPCEDAGARTRAALEAGAGA